jgi:hypothetical protein
MITPKSSSLECHTGTILGSLFNSNPAAYEITFCTSEGDEFGALMNEDELATPCQRPTAADSKIPKMAVTK